MYKNIISQIVEEKVRQNNQIAIEQANRNRIENAKYKSSDLMVGYLSKVVEGRNGRLVKMMSNTPKMFVRVKADMLQDIETGNTYPLIFVDKSPKQGVSCVMEIDIEPFESTCLEAFAKNGLEYDVTLSKNQARDILYTQTRLNSLDV